MPASPIQAFPTVLHCLAVSTGSRGGGELYHLPGFHEPFSVITHLIGAIVFLFLGIKLLRRGWGSRVRVLFLGIYAASCVLQLALSGVYHMMVRGGAAHQVMERLDHGAIFVLIAGTFTPTLGILFRGWFRWSHLILIWAAAVTGITLKTVFFDHVAEWLSLSFYLTLGWFGAIATVLLARRFGFTFIRPLLWGGIAYSIGGAFDLARWPTVVPRVVSGHEVFHIAVLIGAFLHWLFIWQFATGEVQCPRSTAAGSDQPPSP